MSGLVVDASVIASAYFPDAQTDAASLILNTERDLHAPDLIYAELANVSWKRHRRGEATREHTARMLADMLLLPLQIVPIRELAEGALQLAMDTGRSAYDCHYLFLAMQLNTSLITADRRLVNALAGGPFGRYVRWIGDHK